MKVYISYRTINPDFDQEYADFHNEGKEGESNWKYHWGKKYLLNDVKSVSVVENENFNLKTENTITGFVKYVGIPEVVICRCVFEDDSIRDFAVSKSILNCTHQTSRKDKLYFYFYLNEDPPGVQLCSQLVIDEAQMPKELLTTEIKQK